MLIPSTQNKGLAAWSTKDRSVFYLTHRRTEWRAALTFLVFVCEDQKRSFPEMLTWLGYDLLKSWHLAFEASRGIKNKAEHWCLNWLVCVFTVHLKVSAILSVIPVVPFHVQRCYTVGDILPQEDEGDPISTIGLWCCWTAGEFSPHNLCSLS